MAIAQAGDEVADARAIASDVILATSPARVRDDEVLFPLAAAVAGEAMGTTTDEVGRRLAAFRGDPTRLAYQVMVATYLERALSDREWLTTASARLLPATAGEVGGPALRDTALRVLEEALATDTGTAADAVYELRLGEFVLHHEIVSPERPEDARALDVLHELLGVNVANRLQDPDAARALRLAVGPIGQPLRNEIGDVLDGVVDEAIADGDVRAPGTRFDPAVIDWLTGGRLPDELSFELQSGAERLRPFSLEVAIALVATGVRAPRLLGLVALGVLDHYGRWEAIPSSSGLREVIAHAALDDLLVVERSYPRQLPDVLLETLLRTLPWSMGLAELSAALHRRPASDAVRRMAWLRERPAARDRAGDAFSGGEGDALVISATAELGETTREVDFEVLPLYVESLVVLAAQEPFLAERTPLRGNLVVAGPRLEILTRARRVPLGHAASLAAARALDPLDPTIGAESLARLAIIAHPGFPAVKAGELARRLGELEVAERGHTRPLLSTAVSLVWRRLGAEGAAAAQRVSNAVSASVQGDQRDRGDVEKFVREWWKRLGVEVARSDDGLRLFRRSASHTERNER
jgi:hypothetical protein